MLFAAGLSIGFDFYGPIDPLTHFLIPLPYLNGLEPGSKDVILLHLPRCSYTKLQCPGWSTQSSEARLPTLLIDEAGYRSFPRSSNHWSRMGIADGKAKSSTFSRCWSRYSAPTLHWESVHCRLQPAHRSSPAGPGRKRIPRCYNFILTVIFIIQLCSVLIAESASYPMPT